MGLEFDFRRTSCPPSPLTEPPERLVLACCLEQGAARYEIPVGFTWTDSRTTPPSRLEHRQARMFA